MIYHLKVPPNAVRFALIFEEFLHADPFQPNNVMTLLKRVDLEDERARDAVGRLYLQAGIGLAYVGKGPVSIEMARVLIDQLERGLPAMYLPNMLQLFRVMLAKQDHARIILAHDREGFLEVSSDVLRWVEVDAARHGFFAVPLAAVEGHPVARTYQGATMWLPDDVADELRQSWAASDRPALTEPDTPPDREIIAEIVRQFDDGIRLKRDEFKQQLAPGMKRYAWSRLWSEAVKSRPNLKKPGPKPTRSRPP